MGGGWEMNFLSISLEALSVADDTGDHGLIIYVDTNT
jgi:hypothetical protein